jgi:hypothetical protein
MKYITNKESLSDFFDENYYKSINYLDYTTREKKYSDTAKDLLDFFKLQPEDSILDYGCSIGLLMEGYKKLGINDVYGFDISKWAISESKKKNLNTSDSLEILNNKSYKLTTALDVFEHMFDDNLNEILPLINTEYLLVRIPVKLEGAEDYHLEVSRRDMSHVNCKTQEDWILFIENFGYKFQAEISTNTIYSADGCFCGYFKK